MKRAYCEECGFVADDPCQLDVDHINGDRNNDAPINLQTLCSNCHRLKTKRCGDCLTTYGRPRGRPRVSADVEARIMALRVTGHGIIKIAKEVGCGVGTVQRVIATIAPGGTA